MSSSKKVYLITGTSSGIGHELVKQLAAKDNHKIFATIRTSGAEKLAGIPCAAGSSIHVVDGVDVSDDSAGETLLKKLNGSEIDAVIHNAGSLSGDRSPYGAGYAGMAQQNLDKVTMEQMRAAFEVNTLGTLRVQKAVNCLIKEGGKVCVISTGLASIGENTSGGTYAYRTSKAGVNMITKCLSCDLKEKGVSVRAIAPGFVATEFGPGLEQMKKWGAMPVEVSVQGIIKLIDEMNMDNTGEFHNVKKDGSTRVMPW